MKFAREILKDVVGYVPGEQPDSSSVIKLNTNENPYPPSPKVFQVLKNVSDSALQRYPDPVAAELREAAARLYGYENSEWVAAGNGMDELLSLVLRSFVNPGELVLSTDPTYVLYETLVRLHGAKYSAVTLSDDFETMAGPLPAAKLLFLTRPNAPSGVCMARGEVERICAAFEGLVVIDEAYADFADDNCMDFPRRFDNAIVMRTLSKSHALAGLRIGLAVARPEIVAQFLKTKDSYNMNALSQAAAIEALQDTEHVAEGIAKIRATRARLTAALSEIGFSVPPSQSNYVLAQWNREPGAKAIFEGLRKRKIFVRYFENSRLENALRISVGTDSEIDELLSALSKIVTAA